MDGLAGQNSWTYQLDVPAGQTSWTVQFFLFEALASSHIRRLTFQFVHCRSFRVRQRPCLLPSRFFIFSISSIFIIKECLKEFIYFVLKLSIFVVQTLAFDQNGVEFCQPSIGNIRISLYLGSRATSRDEMKVFVMYGDRHAA